MSTAKHTPGPWRVEEADVDDNGDFREATIWADGDGTAANPDPHIAVVRIGLAGSEANAHLISKAWLLPKMAEELERVIKGFHACIIHGGTDAEFADIAVKSAQEVLAKYLEVA